MKYFLTQRQEYIANLVARIPGMKKLLSVPYEAYKRKLIQLRNRNFHKYALEMLEQFDQCMTEHHYTYTLMFGTLLGAVREKGFLKHDLDVDVAVWQDSYSDQMLEDLKAYGFRLRHRFQVENGKLGWEDTIVYKNVSLDIYHIYPPIEEYPYYTSMWSHLPDSVNTVDSMRKFGHIQAVRTGAPFQREIERVPFETLQLPVPTNAHQLLAFIYGEDYMTPNPNFKDEDCPLKRIPWETNNITYQEWEG